MGFFYQAIKKATGVPVELEVAEEPASPAASAMPSSAANAAAVIAGPMHAPAPGMKGTAAATAVASTQERPRPAQHFEVQFPVHNLVAFLSHPVLERNIAAMEQCRIIRTRLRETMKAKKMRSLMFTSATGGEGKTLLSVNLAFAFSQLENTRVLLVDADLRRPAVAKFLKMDPKRGLSTYLHQGHEFREVCWNLAPNMDVVPTLEMAEDSAELLHGQRMQKFLAEASAEYNVVLLDGPPLFPIVDAQVLGAMVDAAVLVVRANSTPYDLVNQAAELLKSKFIGSILNCVERLPSSHSYGSYGGYGGYAGYGSGTNGRVKGKKA